MSTNKDHRFTLHKKGVKYTCPSCGARKSFRRYIDNQTGKELAEDCGICDHKNSCGYHCPPRDYFKEHPETRQDWLKEHQPDKDWAKTGNGCAKTVTTNMPVKEPQAPGKLPMHYVKDYHSECSVFWNWVRDSIVIPRGMDINLANRVFEDYQLGADAQGRVVFWQISKEGEVRTGKFMTYGPDGHRQGNPNWMHYYLRAQRLLPQDYNLQQCFFGEHLLNQYPDRLVNIVESEKTAIIASLFYPNELWLATGGCGLLNEEKLRTLIGRKVKLHPDSGEFCEWKLRALKVPELDCNVLMKYERYPGNTDLADILLN